MDFATFIDIVKDMEHAGDPFVADLKRVIHDAESHHKMREEDNAANVPHEDTPRSPQYS